MLRFHPLHFFLVSLFALSGLILFLTFDFFFGARILNMPDKVISLEEKPYLRGTNGWYELKPNFKGYDQFGPRIYPVETSAYGSRINPGSVVNESYEIVFLGDSFVYGVNGPWDETFVGMFEGATKKKILNGGVGSYSPTAYLYQYRKFLDQGLLKRNHTIILALDISDVQDESGIWIDGDLSKGQKNPTPRYRDEHLKTKEQEFKEPTGLRKFIAERFPLMRLIYRYFRQKIFYPQRDLTNLPRSAFTHVDWRYLDTKEAFKPPHEGYAPGGVQGGLARIEKKLMEIANLAKEQDANLYILIYPWPAQLVQPDKFSWPAFVDRVCIKISCSGVINLFPLFSELAKSVKNFQTEFYFSWDIHFNVTGNRVVADELIKRFHTHQN
jgi:hypothetical protein